MRKVLCLAAAVTILAGCGSATRTGMLREKMENITATKRADVGVAITGLEQNESFTLNAESRYPMQSVFKFHIALAVLNQVDSGRFSLDQKILIRKSDLLPDTWSPLREKYGDGNVEIPLSEILSYTIAQSDNNGCDILLRLVGGTKTVDDYIRSIGIEDFAIVANEEEMHREWNIQFSNWTTPAASTELLKIFFERKLLSEKSHEFLWNTMTRTTTGMNRIKGGVPKGTSVGHKTGTSGTNDEGISAATNDIGIVTLPDGRHFAISIFVANSKESSETNEKIIADITKVAWDFFSGRGE